MDEKDYIIQNIGVVDRTTKLDILGIVELLYADTMQDWECNQDDDKKLPPNPFIAENPVRIDLDILDENQITRIKNLIAAKIKELSKPAE